METQITRIAGLSIQQRPHHAMVVLRQTRGVWVMDQNSVVTGDVTNLENPRCPVVVDATAFFQESSHTIGRVDSEILRAAGWDVRAPNHGTGQRPINPLGRVLERNLNHLIVAGTLVDGWGCYDECKADGARMQALLLAAWGATRETEQHHADRHLASLLPHQRRVVGSLDAWLETKEPIAVVIGDRRSGRRTAVEAWVKMLTVKVETVNTSLSRADDEALFAKVRQDKRDLTVIFDAEHVDSRYVVDALHAGRVVLVNNPVHSRMVSSWLYPLTVELRAKNAGLGRIIECQPETIACSPAVAELARIISPEGR